MKSCFKLLIIASVIFQLRPILCNQRALYLRYKLIQQQYGIKCLLTLKVSILIVQHKLNQKQYVMSILKENPRIILYVQWCKYHLYFDKTITVKEVQHRKHFIGPRRAEPVSDRALPEINSYRGSSIFCCFLCIKSDILYQFRVFRPISRETFRFLKPIRTYTQSRQCGKIYRVVRLPVAARTFFLVVMVWQQPRSVAHFLIQFNTRLVHSSFHCLQLTPSYS